MDAPLDPVNANRYGHAGGDPVNNWDPSGYLKVELGACIAFCVSGGFNYDKDTDKLNIDLSAGIAAGADGYLWIGDSTSDSGNWDISLGYSGGAGFGIGAKGNVGCSLIGNGCFAEGGIGGVLGVSARPSLGVSLPIT